MTTILLSGVGELGGWALEFLARSPEVGRIVTLKRSPWDGPSRTTLAMLSSAFAGHVKQFEHHQADLADTDSIARLLVEVRPDVIIHSATVQSPRLFMQANISASLRARIRAATFGLWLPWHMLPAAWLTRAIERAEVDTKVVNAAFPDVVNPALWKHFGRGPAAGAGNVEVCAVRVLRHAMAITGRTAGDVHVQLVGSHALMAYGPRRVPHCFRLHVGGEDFTDAYDLHDALMSWPEPINWGQADIFSLFAASATKNALTLLSHSPISTHMTAPEGLPGGFPVNASAEGVSFDLPDGLTVTEAAAVNDAAARFDGVERIADDGTVVYTNDARAAMEDLGYHCEAVLFEDLPGRCRELKSLFKRLVAEEGDA